MNLPPPKVCRRIRQLHAMLGSSNANEAAAARDKLLRLLAEYGFSWNDLAALLGEIEKAGTFGSSTPSSSAGGPQAAEPDDGQPEVNVLDLVLFLLEKHIALTAEQRIAAALWILHTYVYDQFDVTPRLALLSPVRGCGKTTLLILLEQLTAQSYRTDDTSAAALIYHMLDRKPHTLLVDEIENLALQRNAVLLKVFNAGHRRSGAISRFLGGWSKKLSVFAPLAVAAIGTLPLPLQSLAVAIQMKRRARDDAELQRLDESDPAWPGSRAEIEKWARTCVLDKDPKMPFINRWSDNWRVLLAIADNLGHVEEARAAAVTLNAGRLDEDPEVTLLRDIRDVFDERKIDRIFSADLVAALNALETGPWADWRGKNDDRPPRSLTQAELGHLLHNFPIKARPMRQRSDRRNRRGYYRADFEKHWAAYCDCGVTPSQRGATKSLSNLSSLKQHMRAQEQKS